ncbi:glycoside hydrolase family 3 protein [Actinomadura verrucosospora]|uniref:Beta-glycosidase, glycosyl hydrolase family 3 n=1 Tax=Actinomadura verrucosospora TaxID=46165 RepID=A0A7D3W4G4_ACTVE|nr:glycoside hydrolase family 3 C-terminal domain-containing protein [Actinomadura verrucosospora]QKG25971.1 beta-glycosidase, glycosyl hydrolase family 3 [Actinomadura verrucosospora]
MSVDESGLRKRLAELTLEEKVHLLSGADFWSLRPIPRIGLRKVVLSDGPSGIRGTAWDERSTSLLFPSPTALAATWDPEAAERVGRLNGAQARDKGVHVQLAPTINLHRTPLGGRHFENYSEDPLLTARIGVGFVKGVQSAGVAATVKHFVGNDSETDRMSYDATIDDATLDAVYMRPFEDAVKAGAWAVMAAYNRVNGTTMTENKALLTDVLKERWGFDGVLMSDWTAIRSTAASANAGMDLEMPGMPGNAWRDRLVEAVSGAEVAEELIDDKVLRILRLAARVGALEGFPEPAPVTTPPDAPAQLRALAARACVLLRNEGGALPLNVPRRLALIGPNAVRFSAQGGGSAHVNPEHVVSPVDGLRRALGGDTELTVHAGVYPHERLAALPLDMAADPETGEPGVRLEFIDADGAILDSEHREAARFLFFEGVPEGTAQIVVRTRVTPAADGVHTFAVAGVGEYDVRVADAAATVNLALAGGDPVEAMMRPPEHRVEVELAAGRAVPVELRRAYRAGSFLTAFGIGYHAPHLPEDEELAAAVEAARAADVAVVIVGTNDDVESEGFDRTTLALPGRQDELVSAVAAANPRTVVVVNAGAPVLMPWRDEVAAVLWAWLPGQEGGDAIADVLTGAAEPGGRLPTTFPVSEDGILSPTPGEDGTLPYAEGAAIGYRHYAPEQVAYPFGHGLGYTAWEYESLTVVDGTAEVTVRNTGDRPGREVVQCYASSDAVPLRLAGFAVAEAAAGERVTVRVPLDERLPGGCAVRAGRSIADLRLTA